MFHEGTDRGAISYLEGERVPKGRCVMTEGIRKIFMRFVNSAIEGGYVKELTFRAAASGISRRGVGVN